MSSRELLSAPISSREIRSAPMSSQEPPKSSWEPPCHPPGAHTTRELMGAYRELMGAPVSSWESLSSHHI